MTDAEVLKLQMGGRAAPPPQTPDANQQLAMRCYELRRVAERAGDALLEISKARDKSESDAAQLIAFITGSLERIANECNCRFEHGAEGAAHLRYFETELRKLLAKIREVKEATDAAR